MDYTWNLNEPPCANKTEAGSIYVFQSSLFCFGVSLDRKHGKRIRDVRDDGVMCQHACHSITVLK